jgi:hypothetical protein
MKYPRLRKSYFPIITFFLLIFSSFFLYLHYKKNPITYIILSKKFELVSYLFFKDLPVGHPPYENYYSITYDRKNDVEELNDFFAQAEGQVSISIPRDTYKTRIPQKLRKLFDHYAKLDPNKEDDRKIIKNIIGTYGEDIEGRLADITSLYRYRDVVLEGEDLQRRIAEYINLFSKKFMVQSITKYNQDERCGKNSYDVIVVFDSNTSKTLDIALTNAGQICFILDKDLMPFHKYDLKDLKEKYQNYWL